MILTDAMKTPVSVAGDTYSRTCFVMNETQNEHLNKCNSHVHKALIEMDRYGCRSVTLQISDRERNVVPFLQG